MLLLLDKDKVCLPHMSQQLHALRTNVLRQMVWFSPLGAKTQAAAEKTTMKMMEIMRDQLVVDVSI